MIKNLLRCILIVQSIGCIARAAELTNRPISSAEVLTNVLATTRFLVLDPRAYGSLGQINPTNLHFVQLVPGAEGPVGSVLVLQDAEGRSVWTNELKWPDPYAGVNTRYTLGYSSNANALELMYYDLGEVRRTNVVFPSLYQGLPNPKYSAIFHLPIMVPGGTAQSALDIMMLRTNLSVWDGLSVITTNLVLTTTISGAGWADANGVYAQSNPPTGTLFTNQTTVGYAIVDTDYGGSGAAALYSGETLLYSRAGGTWTVEGGDEPAPSQATGDFTISRTNAVLTVSDGNEPTLIDSAGALPSAGKVLAGKASGGTEWVEATLSGGSTNPVVLSAGTLVSSNTISAQTINATNLFVSVGVGIGTNNPQEALHVVGKTKFERIITINDGLENSCHQSVMVIPDNDFDPYTLNHGLYAEIGTGLLATNNARYLIANEGFAYTYGSSPVDMLVGVSSDVEVYNGTIDTMIGYQLSVLYNEEAVGTMAGFWNQNPSPYSTVGTYYGMKLDAPSGSGAISNNYGIYIDDHSTKGTSTSINLYSAGENSMNVFDGMVVAPRLVTGLRDAWELYDDFQRANQIGTAITAPTGHQYYRNGYGRETWGISNGVLSAWHEYYSTTTNLYAPRVGVLLSNVPTSINFELSMRAGAAEWTTTPGFCIAVSTNRLVATDDSQDVDLNQMIHLNHYLTLASGGVNLVTNTLGSGQTDLTWSFFDSNSVDGIVWERPHTNEHFNVSLARVGTNTLRYTVKNYSVEFTHPHVAKLWGKSFYFQVYPNTGTNLLDRGINVHKAWAGYNPAEQAQRLSRDIADAAPTFPRLNLATAASQTIDVSRHSLVAISNAVAGGVNVLLTNLTDGKGFTLRATADGTARTLSFFSGAPITWLNTNGTSAATNLYIPANKTAALIGQVWVFAGSTNVDLSAVVQP